MALVLVAVLAAAGCAGIPSLPALPQQDAGTGELRAFFLDVGQGDSSLLLLNGTVILIDAGGIGEGDRVVWYLRQLGVDHIDLLVATHPHADHTGGMDAVLSAFPVGRVLGAAGAETSAVNDNFFREVRDRGIPFREAERGQVLTPDPGLTLLVLSPPAGTQADDLNDNSIILKIVHGETGILYAGDAGSTAEEAVLRAGFPVRAQVLKVSHHGSADAASAPFLAAVRPEIAVIPLAADNPYGYPHRETLALLQGAGAAVYRTDRNGTIHVRCSVTACTVQENPFRNMTPAVLPEIDPMETVTIPGLPGTIAIPVTVPAIRVGNASDIRIEAVQFDAPGDDRGNLNGEWVRIGNSGGSTVLLAGWTLTDNSGYRYTFPAFLLLPGGNVTVCTGPGAMNDTTLFMGRSEPLWGNSGDTAVLRDGSGRVIDTGSESAAA